MKVSMALGRGRGVRCVAQSLGLIDVRQTELLVIMIVYYR